MLLLTTLLLALAAHPISTPDLVNALSAEAPDLRREVLESGLRAFERTEAQGAAAKPILCVIDYDRPSTERRLWVFDLAKKKLLFHELVAHGRGSGGLHATRFSNVEKSLATSLGVFVTGDTYVGSNGYSLRLEGLDEGLNDRARARAIVMHGAPYATEDFAKRAGYLGRSWGCPAVSPRVARPLIDTLRAGGVLVAWADAGAAQSKLLRP